jgi:hypothetical protein
MNKDYFSILFTQDMVMQIGISSIAAHRSIRVAAPSGPDFCCQAAGLVKSGYPKNHQSLSFLNGNHQDVRWLRSFDLPKIWVILVLFG